ncbi:MAG: glycoside hydrolase family 3 N-terminal domain-containing protein [Gemmatimonadota bacterium]
MIAHHRISLQARLLAVCLAQLLYPGAARAQGRTLPPYRDSTLSIEARVSDLLQRMTPTEKFWQLYMTPGDLDDSTHDYSNGAFGLQITPTGTATGPAAARAHTERLNAIQRYFVERTRLGIPIIPFDEGLHGLVREGATAFPQAIALAATWDTALVAKVAEAIARESRSRGVRQLLAPVVNIASDVRWGRVEETYGEDPDLASAMARAYVGSVEHAGVVTTPKHFVANVGEGGRDSYPIELSQRKLEELFFPPFRAAVQEGGARSLMTAYNSVDGTPASQSRWLLSTTLKGAWGFSGFVISDAAATGGATVLHNTEASTATAAKHALEAGLDVIFQSSYEQHRPYLEAFLNGLIADSVIDAAVRRVLRAKFQLGLFESPYVNPDSAAYWNGRAEHRALALETARESIVLLKNRRGVLPLQPSLRSVAVIGTDAVEARLGGYSGPGIHAVSVLDALRQRLGATRVRYAPGPGRFKREYAVIPTSQLASSSNGHVATGLVGEYFDKIKLEGAPSVVRTDPSVDFAWTLSPPAPEIPLDWYAVRWSGRLTVPRSGVRRIGVAGSDGYRLYLDGKLVIDNWQKRSSGVRLVNIALPPGGSCAVRLEFFETTGNGRVQLVWDAGVVDDAQARIDSAVALARRSAVAVAVVGIEEGEFRDRAYLRLPGHQEELLNALARTGKPVVVVLIGGSAITMSRWLDRVDGVIDAWYPGEAGGGAVADVLFGDYNPAGRLPITFPVAEGQLPLSYNHKPTGRGDDYIDLTGAPLFPFGFGLSYTTFEYSALSITPAGIGADGAAVIRCRVRNGGTRAGDEVVQLYVRDLLASVARPVAELKGFQRVHLAPGEERELSFTVGAEQLRMLDTELRPVVEPGTFRIGIGSSSRDLRLRGTLTVR